jgi:hypothetical protein
MLNLLSSELINQKLATVHIEPVEGGSDPAEKRAFQYWPESISDSQSSNYAIMDIPGASLPLYQFISLGERSISFTVYFSRDEDGAIDTEGGGGFVPTGKVPQDKHNVDINGAVAWLRSLQYPAYPEGTYEPPHILKLYTPGVVLSPQGGLEVLTCVITQISVNWMSFFPSGTPRIATVDLTFSEVPQDPKKGGVSFVGRKDWNKLLKDSLKYTVGSK